MISRPGWERVDLPRLAWIGAGLGLGLWIGARPPAESLLALAGAAAGLAAAFFPAIGLGLALLAGPLKAYLAVTRPGWPDPGQVFFFLAAAGWLARGLAERRIQIPRLPVLIPLGLYIFAGLLSLLAASALDEGLKELLKWIEIAGMLIILDDEARRGRQAWILGAILLAGLAQAAAGYWQYAFQSQATGPATFRILGDHFRAYGSFEQPNPYAGFLGLIWPLAAGLGAGGLMAVWEAAGVRPWRRTGINARAQTTKPAEAGCQASHVFFSRLQPASSLERGDLSPRGAATWNSPAESFIVGLRRGHTCGPAAGPSLWPALLASLALLALSAFLLLGLYVSFSRGAWLGAAAAGAALVVAAPRRLSVGLGLALAGLAAAWGLTQAGLVPAAISSRLADGAEFFSAPDVRGANINSANFAVVERLAHWQAAENMAQANPWLGVGLGNYAAAYPRYRLFFWEIALGHAHNIYLNVLAETGLLGLGTYVILWAAVLALTMRRIRSSSGWRRGLALGLLGAWAHLAVHQGFDNLYVNNAHFLVGAWLVLLASWPAARPLEKDAL